jgi:hypothetical protein
MGPRRLLCLCAVAAAAMTVSCSTEAPKKAKEPEKKTAEPVTARYAFHQTFLSARTWGQDLQILRVNNARLEGIDADPGKSAAWEITYVTPSKARARTYTYSVVEQGNVHEGVFGGLDEPYSGPRGQTVPFLVAAFKIDSTEAWETAKGKSADYIKKNPDVPITFVLEKTPRHPNPAWRVIWGTSAGTSNYSVYVDASTGAYLETMR